MKWEIEATRAKTLEMKMEGETLVEEARELEIMLESMTDEPSVVVDEESEQEVTLAIDPCSTIVIFDIEKAADPVGATKLECKMKLQE
nr:MAG: hypothetical protein BEN19_06635 [Epulopiscium sp. Nuni2H_MBin003]